MIASAAEPKRKGKQGAAAPAPPPAALPPPAWRIFVGNLAAGAVSGCAVEAALYPIDTIKTRMQVWNHICARHGTFEVVLSCYFAVKAWKLLRYHGPI